MFQATASLWLLSRKDGECDDIKEKIPCNVLIVGLELWRESSAAPVSMKTFIWLWKLPEAAIIWSVIVQPQYREKKMLGMGDLQQSYEEEKKKKLPSRPFLFSDH